MATAKKDDKPEATGPLKIKVAGVERVEGAREDHAVRGSVGPGRPVRPDGQRLDRAGEQLIDQMWLHGPIVAEGGGRRNLHRIYTAGAPRARYGFLDKGNAFR